VEVQNGIDQQVGPFQSMHGEVVATALAPRLGLTVGCPASPVPSGACYQNLLKS